MMNNLSKYRSYALLAKHCPALAELSVDSEKRWAKIEERVSSRYEYIWNQAKETGKFEYKTHIFDLALYAEKETDWFCASFLGYLNGVFKSIQEQIPERVRSQLNGPVMDLLENFDTNHSRYLDRLGEFLSLERFLSYPDFTLERLETPFEAGTSLDFELRSKDSDSILRTEVMNVHLDVDKLASERDLKIFFGYRLAKKFESKKLPQPPDPSVSIVLVLWGDVLDLLSLAPFFDDGLEFDGYPITFTTLVQYRSSQREWQFKFSTMNSILKEFTEKSHPDFA